jgi:hypothetical protein
VGNLHATLVTMESFYMKSPRGFSCMIFYFDGFSLCHSATPKTKLGRCSFDPYEDSGH